MAMRKQPKLFTVSLLNFDYQIHEQINHDFQLIILRILLISSNQLKYSQCFATLHLYLEHLSLIRI